MALRFEPIIIIINLTALSAIPVLHSMPCDSERALT